MAIDRLERLNALLRRELGDAFFRVFASDGLDMAAITITRVECSRNLRHAWVYVSIYGHEHERGTILHRITRKHGELQKLINRDLTLKYTPRLEFKLDTTVAKGDHILDVLSHIKTPGDDSEDSGDEPLVFDPEKTPNPEV
jgi:ribosome-binding factor A